jgi:hypothetical protein
MEPNPSCVSFGFVVSPTKFVDGLFGVCKNGGWWLQLSDFAVVHSY